VFLPSGFVAESGRGLYAPSVLLLAEVKSLLSSAAGKRENSTEGKRRPRAHCAGGVPGKVRPQRQAQQALKKGSQGEDH